jgi:hypothetical protein
VLAADPRRAPEHLVAQIAIAFPVRRQAWCSRDEEHRAHLAQARLLADQCWGEAFAAGAAYMLSCQQAPIIVATGVGQT